MSETISKDFYLVIPSKVPYRGARPQLLNPRVTTTKSRPSVKPGEVAIRCTINLPIALFREPQFKAVINVNPSAVTSQEVTADVIDNIESIVAEQLGISLTISTDTGEADC